SALALTYIIALVFKYVIQVNPYIASTIGIVSAFFYNFAVSKRFVFRPAAVENAGRNPQPDASSWAGTRHSPYDTRDSSYDTRHSPYSTRDGSYAANIGGSWHGPYIAGSGGHNGSLTYGPSTDRRSFFMQQTEVPGNGTTPEGFASSYSSPEVTL